jgi:hypothetical protein
MGHTWEKLEMRTEFCGKREGRQPLTRPRRVQENIFKWDLQSATSVADFIWLEILSNRKPF